MNKLLAGESPVGMPSVMSRYDEEDRVYPSSYGAELGSFAAAALQWTDLSNYRTWMGTQIAPVIAAGAAAGRAARFAQSDSLADPFGEGLCG